MIKKFTVNPKTVNTSPPPTLFGFPVTTSDHLILHGFKIVFSEYLPSPSIVSEPHPINGLPARTKDGRFVVEGGSWMQISLPLIGLRYAAFAMGCPWEERHNGIIGRFPVTAVWSPEQWEEAHADPEFLIAETLLAETLTAYEQFRLRENIQPRPEQDNTDA